MLVPEAAAAEGANGRRWQCRLDELWTLVVVWHGCRTQVVG